jgi:hypothetical protein
MVAAAEDDRVLGAPGQVQLVAEQEARSPVRPPAIDAVARWWTRPLYSPG